MSESGNSTEKHAKEVARKIFQICNKWEISESLKMIGGDTTASNTGWKGGIFYWFEQFLGRKLTKSTTPPFK